MLVSDPQQGGWGGLRRHGNQACECFNQSHSERRESEAGSAAAGPKLNFDRLAENKGPAGVSGGFCCLRTTPELISSSFDQFYGRLHDFNSSGKAQGLKLEIGAAMNIKQKSLSQGRDGQINCCIRLIVKWEELGGGKKKYKRTFSVISHLNWGQP